MSPDALKLTASLGAHRPRKRPACCPIPLTADAFISTSARSSLYTFSRGSSRKVFIRASLSAVRLRYGYLEGYTR